MEWSEELTVRFVEEYLKHECLYNSKNRKYRNKLAKKAALVKLCEVVNEKDFGAKQAITKLRSIRSIYTQELRKSNKSMKHEFSKGSWVSSDIYLPPQKWFMMYYKVMKGRKLSESNLEMSLASLEPHKRYKVTSLKQLEGLVNYMDCHRDLAMRRMYGKERQSLKNKMWKNLTRVLNGLEGCERNQLGWNKVWNELKFKVKQKAMKIRSAIKTGQPYTGSELTAIEERVLQILMPGVTTALLNDPDCTLLDEDNVDNDTQDSMPSPANNTTDFCDIKVKDESSESEPENSEVNPLNTTDYILEPLESPNRSPLQSSEALKSPKRSPSSRSPTRSIIDKKDRKRSINSRSSRIFCRKFKRRETINEFDVYGKHVALQLKSLSTEQAVLAQAKIQSILTRYRLKSLNNGRSNNDEQSRGHTEFVETVYEEVKETQSDGDRTE